MFYFRSGYFELICRIRVLSCSTQTVDCTQSLIHTYCLSCRSQQASIDRSLFGPPAVRHLHVYVVQGYRASSTTSSLLRKPEELSDLLYFSFKPDNNRVTDEAIRAMQDYTCYTELDD